MPPRGNQSATIRRTFEEILGYKKLLYKLVEKPEEMKATWCDLQTAKKDFDQLMMVILVGSYSAGKSTLINSLVGKEVCATGIKPTTSDLDYHTWGECLLVDSAGLDAMHLEEHKKKALEAARRSNVAVVVVNARQPLRDSEGIMLKELVKANSKVIVVLNYWNHMEDESERKECLDYVRDIVAQWMPGKRPEIIPVNAKRSDDEGVGQLRQLLQSDGMQDNSQKNISAEAAQVRCVEELTGHIDSSLQKLHEDMRAEGSMLEEMLGWHQVLKDSERVKGGNPLPMFLTATLGAALTAATGGVLPAAAMLATGAVGAVAGGAGQTMAGEKLQQRDKFLQEEISQRKEAQHASEGKIKELREIRDELKGLVDSSMARSKL